MKLYLAGPMRGLTLMNFPAFRAAASVLRKSGVDTVVSPVEIDAAVGLDEHSAELSTREYMQRDLPELLKCDALVLLPGYRTSKGAMTEIMVASMCGMPIYRYLFPDGGHLVLQQVAFGDFAPVDFEEDVE